VHPDRALDAQLLLTSTTDRRRRHIVLVPRNHRCPALRDAKLLLQSLLQAADIAAGSDGPHDKLFNMSQMLLGSKRSSDALV
jgi:hypothetical protein